MIKCITIPFLPNIFERRRQPSPEKSQMNRASCKSYESIGAPNFKYTPSPTEDSKPFRQLFKQSTVRNSRTTKRQPRTKMLFKKKSSRRSSKCINVEGPIGSQDYFEPKSSYFDGLVNNFRCTLGTGILSMPIAFSQAGYLGAAIGIIFINIIANYCALILVECQRELLKRNKDMIPTYQGTVQAAFAGGPKSLRKFSPFFLTFTNVFILIGPIGGVCVELVFISTNLKAAVYPHLDMDLRYFELLVAVPVLAISMIPDMKKLSIVSSFGNINILMSIAVVLYYVFKDTISFDDRNAFGTFKQLPEYLGIAFYCTVTITLVLPLENEMKYPGMLQGPLGILNVTTCLSCLLHIFFGLIGYLKYGDEVASTVTLNLPSNNGLSLTVQILLSLSSFTSLAIALYIGVSIVWSNYLDKRLTKHRTLAQYLLRIGFVLFTLTVAILVPDLEVLLAVLGIVTQCTLSSTLPSIINILTHYQQPSSWAYIRKFWFDVVTFLFTIFVVFCSFSSRLIVGS